MKTVTIRTGQVKPPDSPPQRYFLGVTTSKQPNWQHFFAEPQAPKRYKEEAAKNYREEKLEQQAERADRFPISGMVDALCVLDLRGNTVFETSRAPTDPSYIVAVRFAEFINSDTKYSIRFMPELPAQGMEIGIRWCGFDIRENMHIMALNCMSFNGTPGLSPEAKVKIPLGMWYHRMFEASPLLDPYEALLPSDARKEFDVSALCEYLHIPVPQLLATDVQAKAEIARLLALRGQFWNLATDTF